MHTESRGEAGKVNKIHCLMGDSFLFTLFFHLDKLILFFVGHDNAVEERERKREKKKLQEGVGGRECLIELTANSNDHCSFYFLVFFFSLVLPAFNSFRIHFHFFFFCAGVLIHMLSWNSFRI